jgi:sugar/nucleoside kinase (ribokinase family)
VPTLAGLRRRRTRGRTSVKAGPRPEQPLVIVSGAIYCDLIFSGLRDLPAPGEEVRTDRFSLAVGGGAFITAAGLARLGLRTTVRAYVGRGPLGQFQLDALRRAGVDTSQVVRHPGLGPGLSVAFSTPHDRGFITYPGCAGDAGTLFRSWRWKRRWNVTHRVRHVHFAGIPRPLGQRAALLERLRREGITTSLDIGWNPSVYTGDAFRRVLGRVTVFMPSWRDAQRLTGRDTPEEALRDLAGLVPVPVIKLGPDGAIGLDDGRPVRVRPPTVRAVETTGAGDAFNAGFLWAWLRGEPIRRCLLAGNVCGAHSTRAPGGTAAFPTVRELRAALREAGLG